MYCDNRNVVKESYAGTVGGTFTCTNYKGYSICLINDGASNITLTVNGLSFTVKPNETFDERIGMFTEYTVTDGIQHRRRIRGW